MNSPRIRLLLFLIFFSVRQSQKVTRLSPRPISIDSAEVNLFHFLETIYKSPLLFFDLTYRVKTNYDSSLYFGCVSAAKNISTLPLR